MCGGDGVKKYKNKHTNVIVTLKGDKMVSGSKVYMLEKENGDIDNWSEELFLLHWEAIPWNDFLSQKQRYKRWIFVLCNTHVLREAKEIGSKHTTTVWILSVDLSFAQQKILIGRWITYGNDVKRWRWRREFSMDNERLYWEMRRM